MGDASHATRPGRGLPRAIDVQRTIARPLRVTGVGLRSGLPVAAELLPAPADTGRVFVRDGTTIPALLDHVVDTRLATTLGRDGVTISMIEHLCAALHAIGVDAVEVRVDGPELPVLDGSAMRWMQALRSAGTRPLGALRRPLEVAAPVRVAVDGAWAEILPARGLELDIAVDFPHPLIGAQRWAGAVTPATFGRELAWARTFGFLRDAEALRAAGLALGASLENTVVYDDDGVMSPGGLRAPDEAVRHKALDAVGDIALLGRPLHGRMRASKAGHALHVALLRAAVAAPT